MVEIIGLVTVGALVWLLAWSMAGESDAEQRRLASASGDAQFARPVMPEKRAA